MHIFDICDVTSTFIDARASGSHMFGLKGDQTLYVACLFTLQQNVGNVVHSLVTPSISQPPLHSLEPIVPKVVHKFGLNPNRPSSRVCPLFAIKPIWYLLSLCCCHQM